MKNKYILGIALIAIMVLSVAFVPVAMAGNGAPSGTHYNLNVLGKEKVKGWAEPDPGNYHDNGHRLFVKYDKNGMVNTRINLIMGDDFQVIDPDGTDGKATLQLPDPWIDTDGDEVADAYAYDIYVRALGKPNDNRYAEITLHGWNISNSMWYLGETVEVRRTNGAPKFQQKTVELTTVYALDGSEYHLFDYGFSDFFWNYDNYGLKTLQIRFYPRAIS